MPHLSTQERYVNPYTDFGFKRIFGVDAHKDLLIDFLNNLIGGEHGTITDIQYLTSEQLGKTKSEREVVFDIYCKTETGERFIVEMQKAEQNYFKDRSVYYTTFPIQEQAKKGKWNFKLDAVYFVGILDFVFSEDKGNDEFCYRHDVMLMDIKRKTVFYDKLRYIYLEMPNFKKTENELSSVFDKWLYALKFLPELQKRPAKLQERVFKNLFDVAEVANFTDAEILAYEESLKIYRDLINVVDTAKSKGRKKGLEEGLAKGLAKGLAEGLAKGRVEGRTEGLVKGRAEGELAGEARTKQEIARKLKAKGYPLADIAEISGLSESEIKKCLKPCDFTP